MSRPAVVAGLLAVAAAAWWRAAAVEALPDEAEQWTGQGVTLDGLAGEVQSMMTEPNITNRAAFLMTIRAAEGTDGPNGYRMTFGGSLVGSLADHPRIARQFTDRQGRRLWTSAAGAYQFMAVSKLPDGRTTRVDTWDRLARKLGLPDFEPDSQDAAAVELIREAGALADVDAGRFALAVSKVRRTWASLPGAGYSQGERSLAWLEGKYRAAGGVVA